MTLQPTEHWLGQDAFFSSSKLIDSPNSIQRNPKLAISESQYSFKNLMSLLCSNHLIQNKMALYLPHSEQNSKSIPKSKKSKSPAGIPYLPHVPSTPIPHISCYFADLLSHNCLLLTQWQKPKFRKLYWRLLLGGEEQCRYTHACACTHTFYFGGGNRKHLDESKRMNWILNMGKSFLWRGSEGNLLEIKWCVKE